MQSKIKSDKNYLSCSYVFSLYAYYKNYERNQTIFYCGIVHRTSYNTIDMCYQTINIALKREKIKTKLIKKGERILFPFQVDVLLAFRLKIQADTLLVYPLLLRLLHSVGASQGRLRGQLCQLR